MRQGVLRFPLLTSRAWFRIAAILDARGELPAPVRRMCEFLTYQRIGRWSGRIVGRRGTDHIDGGMELAERYAARYNLAPDRFWADFRALSLRGLAERIVAPAPGRKAVYALVLTYDAIPNGLPEDLARELQLYDLPEVDDPDEDAAYGRLTDAEAPQWQLQVEPVQEREAAELQAAPRWEPPAASPAALAAEAIVKAARHLPEDERPRYLRCLTIARPQHLAENPAFDFSTEPKTSPYTRRGFSPSGFDSAGSRGLSSVKDLVKTETTPSAAPTKSVGLPSGDDPRAVAQWVLQRAWHAWRAELGFGQVILTSGRYDAAGEWHSSPAWDDLRRVVMIALRRTTPTNLVEILSSSVQGAADVGRLAAWRCWKLINSQRDQHGYRKRPAVPVTPQLTAWDEASPAELRRHRAAVQAGQLAQVQARHREEQERRRQEVETRHRLFLQRLGINPDPRREPEHVHREQYPEPLAPGPGVPENFDQLTPQQRAQVAAARARADRARRGKAPKQRRSAAAVEAARQENTDRLMQRLRAKAQPDEH